MTKNLRQRLLLVLLVLPVINSEPLRHAPLPPPLRQLPPDPLRDHYLRDVVIDLHLLQPA